jgi:hypothetical protein
MAIFFKKSCIEKFGEFECNHYSNCDLYIDFDNAQDQNKVSKIFKDMYQTYLSKGGSNVPGTLHIDGAVLLEKDQSPVAAIFYDLQKSISNVTIVLAFVDENFRRQGLYRKLHSLIDVIGKEHGRIGVVSFMSFKDSLMIDTIGKSIGYTPIYQLVHREIK